jgi:internalin A
MGKNTQVIRAILKFSLPALLTGASFFCFHTLEAEAQSFEQWCQQKNRFQKATQHTINVLLGYAGTKDCSEANTRLNRITTPLQLQRQRISDVSPIASLNNVTWLLLSSNDIRDVRPLATMTRLTKLELAFNQIEDVKPLVSLTNLYSLYLNGNRIRDVEPLANLTKLDFLTLGGNPISPRCPLQNQRACHFDLFLQDKLN